ncbi:MAG: GNAT family N-acetyltransferase [Candidatus Omnitrophota bacterium]|nr:GNAT family N-acetyltransferase [Candidatus Omnitrophota bacterium]
MQITDKILIRKAVHSDAESLSKIVAESFPPQDNQRIFGERITLDIFEIFFRSDDAIFLIAQDQEKILGYLWLQLEAPSFFNCFKNAVLKTTVAAISILKEFKFKELLILLRDRKNMNSSFAPYPKIMSLAVARQARMKGVGRELISEIQKYLSVKGAQRYFVLTSTTNTAAISFYEKNGFYRYKHNEGNIVFYKNIEGVLKNNSAFKPF